MTNHLTRHRFLKLRSQRRLHCCVSLILLTKRTKVLSAILDPFISFFWPPESTQMDFWPGFIPLVCPNVSCYTHIRLILLWVQCVYYKLPTAMMVVTWITVGRWPIITWWVLSDSDLWFLSSEGEQQQQIGLDLAPTATQEDMPADTQKAETWENKKSSKTWWPGRCSKHTAEGITGEP